MLCLNLGLLAMLLWPASMAPWTKALTANHPIDVNNELFVRAAQERDDVPTTASAYVFIDRPAGHWSKPPQLAFFMSDGLRAVQIAVMTKDGPTTITINLRAFAQPAAPTPTPGITGGTPVPLPTPAADAGNTGGTPVPLASPSASFNVRVVGAGVVQTGWGAFARYSSEVTTGSLVRVLASTSPKGGIAGALRVNGAVFDAPNADAWAPAWSERKPVNAGALEIEWLLSPSTAIEIDGIEVKIAK